MVWFGKEIDIPEESPRKEDKSRKTVTSSSQSWFSSSTGQTDDSAKSREAATARSKSVLMGRGVFLFFLALVAIALGFLAWFFLDKAEQHLVEEQYYSMMARALEVTRSLAVSNKHSNNKQLQLARKSMDWFLTIIICCRFFILIVADQQVAARNHGHDSSCGIRCPECFGLAIHLD